MAIEENDIKKASLMLLVLVLAILVFLILKPVMLSIIGGLILAYILNPVYSKFCKWFKHRTLAAAIVSIILLALIILPLWFLLPMVSQQVFDLFSYSQELGISRAIRSVFPTASDQFVGQVDITITNALSNITSAVLNSSVDFLLNFAPIALHLLLVAFVFFFALKDGHRLKEFVSGLSPLNKTQEKAIVKQFEDITRTIIYGQIVLGLLQGIFAAIGFLAFGVPNAVALSVAAVILSIIPVIGPSIVYIPVTIYLLITSSPLIAIGFLLYNILIVSSIDNVLRSHLVSRKTQISQAIVLIGMIGGLFIFGILGLILGPLILAYFITFLRAYKDKTLSSFFRS
jgi:predicted PurR-regulated permease PerM